MKCINRFEKFRDDVFDRVMLLIQNRTIKCGKYSSLVKVDGNKKIQGRSLFDNENGDRERE